MRPEAGLAAGAALSAGLLVLSGLATGAWWQLFTVFFVPAGLLPMALGSHDSTGVWGSLGDFIEALFAFSMFAFPTVLYRVDELNGLALFLCYASSTVALVTIFTMFRLAQSTSYY